MQLRVFEDRYLQMLKDLEANPFFVISLISHGDETGPAATPFRVGTLVECGETETQGDLLYIKPLGVQRVYMETFDRESRPYLMADCVRYDDESAAGADRTSELEDAIYHMTQEFNPEERGGIREVLEEVRSTMDLENYSLFLCGCLHLPPIYLQRLLESRSLSYRIDNALNLLSQSQ